MLRGVGIGSQIGLLSLRISVMDETGAAILAKALNREDFAEPLSV